MLAKQEPAAFADCVLLLSLLLVNKPRGALDQSDAKIMATKPVQQPSNPASTQRCTNLGVPGSMQRCTNLGSLDQCNAVQTWGSLDQRDAVRHGKLQSVRLATVQAVPDSIHLLHHHGPCNSRCMATAGAWQQ